MSGVEQPEIVVPDDVASAAAAMFHDAVTAMWANASGFLDLRGLVPPALRVVAATDVWATCSEEGVALGLGPDRRSGPERVGGEVAGKCLMSDDGRAATIVVPAAIAAADDGYARLFAAGLVGHEIGHVLYATQRTAAIGQTTDVWLPWEVAEMLAVVAAEEYRVNRIGAVLAESTLRPTDDDGQDVLLDSVLGPGYRDELAAALDHVVPGLPDLVWSYRSHQMTLEDMWTEVVRVCGGATNYMAHTAAYSEAPDLVFEASGHDGVVLLEPLWRPFFDHLSRTPALPEADEWSEDRAQLQAIGSEGFTAVWARLGLVATAAGDTFHLAVDDPEDWAASSS